MTASALDRFERTAGWGARTVRRIAAVAAAAELVVVVYLFRDGVPDDAREWVVELVLLAAVAWPAVVLLLLAQALAALAALPRRVLDTPHDARSRAGELAALAQRATAARGTRLPLTLWRFLRTAASSRELLTPHAAVLPLISLPFLALSAAAAAATAVLAVVALVLLVLLLL